MRCNVDTCKRYFAINYQYKPADYFSLVHSTRCAFYKNGND